MSSVERPSWPVTTGNPVRFLASARPWRSLAYLLSGSVVGLACMIAMALVCLPMPPAVVLLAVPVAEVERSRLRLVDPVPVLGAHRAVPAAGPSAWARTRLGERATWREFAYTLLLSFVLWPLGLLVAAGVPILAGGLLFAAGASLVYPRTTVALLVFSLSGPAATVAAVLLALFMTVLGAYLTTFVAIGHAALARTLMGGREEQLEAQVTEIARSRRRLADAFEAERRRIERDLHDGAQQRLTSLAIKLGTARLELRGTGAALIDEAYEDARQALAELREIVHGIHPPLLTDRGLPPALAELARRSAAPARVDVELPGRLPPTVESTAYFVVSEALTNVVRHARAGSVAIRGRLADGVLTIEVTDNGVGGASVRTGGGLQGLIDRAAVVDGVLAVTSPLGGPTVLRLSVPQVECRR
ncbi:sensor histidine kinase [Actinomadura sp. DC4]|uniref:sensor histidine kinase n=1 Tax=Actinomadura sp. DC4 TaxID=3055069 RepID=UPI0025B19AA0|nr:sensor histidine kinase [Actinomadura sp. DC4]MDN3357876.1 sensor histidine kinase [Actinomadura sp. DC4]